MITDSLIPANQLSTDDFAGHLENQTNLAIKGIIGIRAMAEIESLRGNSAQSENYTVRMPCTRCEHLILMYLPRHSRSRSLTLSSGKILLSRLQETISRFRCVQSPIACGGMPTHAFVQYGNSSSWGLAYNLYSDKLLKFDLFPQSVYEYASHQLR